MPYADPARQRAAHNEACERWRAKSAKRYAAQQAVKKAIASGALVRWPGCAACHRKRGLEAHHADYDHPLSVVWLCMKCHKAAHSIVGFRDTDPHASKVIAISGYSRRARFSASRSLNAWRDEQGKTHLRAVRAGRSRFAQTEEVDK